MKLPKFINDFLVRVGIAEKPVIEIVSSHLPVKKQSGPTLAAAARCAQVFNGAATCNQMIVVKGADLVAGESYKLAGGLLVIDGDVPPKTKITVDSGKLYISGNVGAEAEVRATAPQNFKLVHDKRHVLIARSIVVPQNVTYRVSTGLAYPKDRDATVTIIGNLDAYAKAYGSHGLRLDGRFENTSVMDHGKGSFQHLGDQRTLYAQPAIDAMLRRRASAANG